ncbi:hypothetical protein AB0D68_08685 [Streptomyces sp. NPDC048212]|uniref:hypothetical protein n=1 Tax=Streptomyces sp. NPDC048212 TaxID=3156658 RepID=UPI00340D4F8B
MSRRRSGRRSTEEYPRQLAEFDVADWWVTDPECPMAFGYARINWSVARQVYREGGDWQSYLEPPVWWDLKSPDP